MRRDDSFKKPGAVPFKWEIRPGIPKIQDPLPKCQPKIKPPPAGLYFQPPLELPRTHSFGSSPSTRFNHHRIDMSGIARPEIVSSGGCFPSPMVKRKNNEKKGKRNRLRPRSEPEYEYSSDLETSSRWSISSRKPVSPFSSSFASYGYEYSSDLETPSRWSISSRKPVSPFSSSFASYGSSSPIPVSDAEWAAFGLFY